MVLKEFSESEKSALPFCDPMANFRLGNFSNLCMEILERRLLSFAKFYPFKRSAAAKFGANLRKKFPPISARRIAALMRFHARRRISRPLSAFQMSYPSAEFAHFLTFF